MPRRLEKQIIAPNGDAFVFSFDLSETGEGPEVSNIDVKVFNFDKTQSFDLTQLFDEDELLDCSKKIIQAVTYDI